MNPELQVLRKKTAYKGARFLIDLVFALGLLGSGILLFLACFALQDQAHTEALWDAISGLGSLISVSVLRVLSHALFDLADLALLNRTVRESPAG